MQIKTNAFFPAIMFALISFIGCKKTQDVPAKPIPTPTPIPVAVTTDPEKIKDSALLYSKDLYLWYNQIPSTFDARSNADPIAIMTGIRQYSIEPGFSAAVDRWSFAMKKTE